MKNLFEDIKIDKNSEEFIDILNKPNIRIQRIVSNGQASKEGFWYEQEENEFVTILEGEAVLEFEDKDKSDIVLKKGDFCNIEVKEKHRLKYTSIEEPTIWLAIFY